MPARHASSAKLKVFHALTLVFILAMSILNIYAFEHRPREVVVTNTLASDLSYWEEMIEENPSYRDAYIVVSQIKSRSGNKEEAKKLLQIAQEIDPFANLNKNRFVLGEQTSLK